MQIQYNVLHYKTDLHFHGYKLAIEIDGNRYSDRNIDHEIKIQKEIEQGFGCKFVRIDPDKEDFEFLELSMKYLYILNNELKNL